MGNNNFAYHSLYRSLMKAQRDQDAALITRHGACAHEATLAARVDCDHAAALLLPDPRIWVGDKLTVTKGPRAGETVTVEHVVRRRDGTIQRIGYGVAFDIDGHQTWIDAGHVTR